MTFPAADTLRSQLFIPALTERFADKAHTRGADAIIIDLEDAIAPQRKGDARQAVGGMVSRIAAKGLPVSVRVNNEPALLDADLEAAVAAAPYAVMLPKAEDPAQVQDVARRLEGTDIRLVLLLESPRGLLRAAELASCSERVVALGFGSEDYANCMGVRTELEAMRQPAYTVALAARAWGRAAWGVVGSIAEIADLAAFGRMATCARDLGYTGALAIHPVQVPVLNGAFGPTAAEVEEARAIVAAFGEALARGEGAAQFNGRMLDKPIVDRARNVLRRQGPSPSA